VALLGGREIDNPLVVFERLSKESGAESFFPRSEKDLKKAIERISAILRAQYMLAYYPPDAAHFRKIEVRVRRRGVRVLSRRSAAGDAGALVHFSASSCEVSTHDHPCPWEQRVTQNGSGGRIYHEDFSNPATGWPNRREEETRETPARGYAGRQPGLRWSPAIGRACDTSTEATKFRENSPR
jgi:hypothetical protein